MKMIAFDLETTGTDPATARIVTFSCIAMNPPHYPDPAAHGFDGIINPGIDIPVEASAVHGITTERAREEGLDPNVALPAISDYLNVDPQHVAVCAFNARYDLTVLAHELRRHNLPYEWIGNLRVIDPLVIDKQLDKYRRGKRTLEAVCSHYGVVLENAHTADADALAAGLVFQVMQQKFKRELAFDLRGLHAAQVHWAAEQAASLQEYFRRTNPEAFVEPRWPYYLTEEEVPA